MQEHDVCGHIYIVLVKQVNFVHQTPAAHLAPHSLAHQHLWYMYVWIHMCVCVCVYECVWARSGSPCRAHPRAPAPLPCGQKACGVSWIVSPLLQTVVNVSCKFSSKASRSSPIKALPRSSARSTHIVVCAHINSSSTCKGLWCIFKKKISTKKYLEKKESQGSPRSCCRPL
jgi:hypothetical protein